MTGAAAGVIDASSAINLINAVAFGIVLDLPQLEVCVGPIVQDECRDETLDRAIADGRIRLLDDSVIPAGRYLQLLETYDLGPGETECLAFADAHQFIVITDDGAARAVATELFGGARVTGSIGLLRRAVQAGLLTAGDAWARYEMMKAAGGFLPEIERKFFES